MEQPVDAHTAAVVRIRDGQRRVVGAGVLVGPRDILTCAHVVSRALGLPTDAGSVSLGAELTVDFPLVAPDRMLVAKVVAWHPSLSDGTGDVAGLCLTDAPPARVRPAGLIVSGDLWGHQFRAFGFPAGHDDGVWASGLLLAGQATGWIQLDDDRHSGFAVGPGFSGTPVWDRTLGGVVGVAVVSEARDVARTAYLIPNQTVLELWPTALAGNPFLTAAWLCSVNRTPSCSTAEMI